MNSTADGSGIRPRKPGLPIAWSVLLAVAVLVLPAAGSPLKLRTLTLDGNHSMSSREILSSFATHVGGTYAPSQLRSDMANLEEAYNEKGYLAATVRLADSSISADSTAVDIRLEIQEGRRSIIGAISVRGVSLIPGQVADEFSSREGDPLSPAALERDIDALLARYERIAHPFARCSVESLRARPGEEVDTLDIGIVVDEGPKVTIDEMRVEGNKETSPSVILRESRIAAGDPYDPVKVEALRRNLLKLSIFSSVEEPILYRRDQHDGLLIRVQEGSTNSFDGIIGYIPASAGQSGYVTGLASVSMRNLFGTGRKLQLRWQKEDLRSEEIQARYMEPWVMNLPFNLEGGFLQRQQDSSYVQRTLDLRVEAMPAENLTAGLSMSSQQVIPSSDSTYQSPIPSSSTLSFGADLQYDTRSDPVNPLSGARYGITYAFGRKRATASVVSGLGGGSSTIQRLTLDVNLYLQIIRRQVLAFGLHGYDVRGGNIGESDMFRFGGATTLRGYRENQFLGAEVAWTNTEYRFILERRSYLFLFFDTGYYSRPADEVQSVPSAEALKYGYGLGIRVDTALGNIGVSFALGQGDSFSTAKIHVNILNEF